MPEFEPVRTGRGLLGSLRGAGRWPRAVAVSLAVAFAAAALWEPYEEPGGYQALPAVRSAAGPSSAPASSAPSPSLPPPASSRSSPPADDGDDGDGTVTVDAPVRLPDAAVARLLQPGDRVDVLATAPGDTSGAAPADRARIIARNVRVTAVPDPGPGPDSGAGGEAGALVVLSVSRPVAARITGAAARSRLAVTLC